VKPLAFALAVVVLAAIALLLIGLMLGWSEISW
jgi:hypothetical protein